MIRRNNKTGKASLDPLRWGLDPSLVQRPGGWAQANQRQMRDGAHLVRALPSFRDAYRLRRCIVSFDGFFASSSGKR